MKIGFVIPSRLKSSRLPRKNLMMLNDQTALEWVIDRAAMVNGIDEVVVATTMLASDAEVTKICIRKGVRYFQGSPDDVIVRLRDTAIFFDFDYIINITPDNTLFSMYLAELMVKSIKENTAVDFVKYGDALLGTGVYALRREAMQTVCDFKTEIDTEIWGPLFNKKYFNVLELSVPSFLKKEYRLTLDTEADYMMIKEVYHGMSISKRRIPELYDVIRFLDEHPAIASMNAQIVQRSNTSEVLNGIELLFKSNQEKFDSIKRKYYGGN